jgi:hypothetical protein
MQHVVPPQYKGLGSMQDQNDIILWSKHVPQHAAFFCHSRTYEVGFNTLFSIDSGQQLYVQASLNRLTEIEFTSHHRSMFRTCKGWVPGTVVVSVLAATKEKVGIQF